MRSPSFDRTLLVVGLVVLATLVAYVLTIRPGHNWGDDFSMYVQHARNIAEGRRYADTPVIYNPQHLIYAPPSYPPVFPGLLAPMYRLRGLDFEAFKVVGIVFFALSLLVVAMAFRRHLPGPYLVALVAALAANPYLWAFKDQVLSEFPFLFFVWTSVLMIERTPVTDRPLVADLWTGLGIGTVVYLAYGTRSLGVVLVPCWLAYDVLRVRRVTRAAVVGATVFVGLAILQSALLHSDRSYLAMFTARPGFVLSNGYRYLLSLRGLVDNGVSASAQSALAALGGVMALGGLVLQARPRPTMSELFLIAYIAAILPFLGHGRLRYLIPIVPLLGLYVVTCLHRVVAALGGWGRLAAVSLACAVTLSYVGAYAVQDFGPIRDGISAPDSQEFFEYVRRETAPTDVFVLGQPRALALLTGRPASVYLPRDASAAQYWDHVTRLGATYVVLGPHRRPHWRAFVEGALEQGRVVETFASGRFRVFRVHRG